MTQTEGFDSEALAAEIDAQIKALPNRQTAQIRAVRRKFSKHLSQASAPVMLELALRLRDRHRFVAYELIHHHPAARRSLGETELVQLGHGLDSWGAVDTFACYLAGPAWREHQIPDTLIQRWASSEDHWWRRAALVSTVPLNSKAQGGSGDTPRTLPICRLLAGDPDDMVVKALSWALRELAKRDPQAVAGFLAEYEAVLAARVKREVKNKLTTGLKNPRRE